MCIYKLHISQGSALIETMTKEWWGGLQFPTITIFHRYSTMLVILMFISWHIIASSDSSKMSINFTVTKVRKLIRKVNQLTPFHCASKWQYLNSHLDVHFQAGLFLFGHPDSPDTQNSNSP